MKVIKVRVIPNAKRNKVSAEIGRFKVYVTASAVNGKANKAMIKVLSDFFNIKNRNIRIIRGEKSREKVIEIDDK